MKTKAALFLYVVLALGNFANGDYILTLDASPTTYSTTLTFDEPGGPTGVIDPTAFSGIGLSELQSGDGVPVVADHATPLGAPWLGTDNSFTGAFGVFATFANDLTDFATQVQDPSGPPSPFGGGAGAFVFNDGVEVASFFFEPAWGGVGDEFLNITTTGGDVFDEVRILGFGFFPTTFVDDLSWNAAVVIPEPGSAFLIGILGIAGFIRRR